MKEEILNCATRGVSFYDETWTVQEEFWETESLNADYIQHFCHRIADYFKAEGLTVEFNENYDGEEGSDPIIHLHFCGWA